MNFLVEMLNSGEAPALAVGSVNALAAVVLVGISDLTLVEAGALGLVSAYFFYFA